MNDPRLSSLVERYFDRESDADEIAELQTLLRENAAAREYYWEVAEWHALLRQWGEQEWGRDAAKAQRRVTPMPTVSRPVPRPQGNARGKTLTRRKVLRFPFARWATGIAAVAAVVVFLTLQPHGPVATLDQVAEVSWKSGKFEPNGRLKPGSFQLETGAAVIAFDRGARVVIEGPAKFELRDDNSMILRDGKARAHVPESAHGFKLQTPRFTAVDIGTQFGCDVSTDGIGELHVFEGNVDLQSGPARKSSVRLSENQAMRVEGEVSTPLAARPLAFLSETEMAGRQLRESGDLLGAWRMAGRQLDEHPATLLHLDFEGTPGADIPNKSKRAPLGSNAKAINGGATEGRWPGKGARTFQAPGDRLEFSLPGQFESLTLLAWIRVDSIHGEKNSLVMGHSSQTGEVHWYLYGNGALGVGILSKMEDVPGNWRNFHSEPLSTEATPGSWAFIATVLDGPTGIATHYLNGKPVASKDGIVRTPLQLTMANVADHESMEPRKPGDPPSNFNGSIDELAVLSTALTPEDIARLYQQGKPGAR
jgi:hypothetical protein